MNEEHYLKNKNVDRSQNIKQNSLTTFIQQKVVTVTELLESTSEEDVLVPKEVSEAQNLCEENGIYKTTEGAGDFKQMWNQHYLDWFSPTSEIKEHL